MEKPGTKQKWIWAVDPLATDKSLTSKSAWALRELAKDAPADIEPIYVVEGYALDVPLRGSNGSFDEIREAAQTSLEGTLRRIRVPGLHPLRVLVGTGSSLREKARILLQHARSSGAELIVASTRSRKGPKRWLLGSFAETLVLASDIPVFLVNPFEKVAPAFKSVLFPTDFSQESRRAFDRVVEFAKARDAKITLFHKADASWMMGMASEFSAHPVYADILRQDLESRRKEAEQWSRDAARRGARVTIEIEESLAGNPADAILRRAARRKEIIAMATRRGTMEAALLGSTARRVVRESTMPVWILHPLSAKTGKAASKATRANASRPAARPL